VGSTVGGMGQQHGQGQSLQLGGSQLFRDAKQHSSSFIWQILMVLIAP